MAAGLKTGGRQKGTPNKTSAPQVEQDMRVPEPASAAVPARQTSARREAADPARPKIRFERTDDLIPYANNARTHSDRQIAKIAASIRKFGFTNPVLTDGKHGIIAGHGRVLAAQILAMETVPVIWLSNLNAEERKAYIIADNKLAEDAGWDDGLLQSEMGDLPAELRKLTGFDAHELKTMFGDPDDLPGGEDEAGLAVKKKQATCPNCGHVFAPGDKA